MAYIRQIEPADATGPLRDLYDRLVEVAGGVPNIVKLSSLKPAAAIAAQDLYQSVLYHDSVLTMVQKEMVSVVVSVINGCVYCFTHHGNALRRLTGDDALVDQVIADHRSAPLDPVTRVVVDFADRLTRDSAAMSEADVAALRGAGLSDETIVDLVQLVAYFNYTNRLAVALGVDPEVEH